jgi:hypothetical protein
MESVKKGHKNSAKIFLSSRIQKDKDCLDDLNDLSEGFSAPLSKKITGISPDKDGWPMEAVLMMAMVESVSWRIEEKDVKISGKKAVLKVHIEKPSLFGKPPYYGMNDADMKRLEALGNKLDKVEKEKGGYESRLKACKEIMSTCPKTRKHIKVELIKESGVWRIDDEDFIQTLAEDNSLTNPFQM